MTEKMGKCFLCEIEIVPTPPNTYTRCSKPIEGKIPLPNNCLGYGCNTEDGIKLVCWGCKRQMGDNRRQKELSGGYLEIKDSEIKSPEVKRKAFYKNLFHKE